jgi:NAD(P)-dependent dehydrogenase (short-subunit alcohol dehydrogenase family)
MKLHGTVSIVTGGASGLGAATVTALQSAGSRTAILDTNEEQGLSIAKETGGSFFKTDITSEENVLAALAAIDSHFGQSARILVNCAGVLPPLARTVGKQGAYPLELFQQIINVNLVGAFNITRLTAARMSELSPLESDERGVIINVASISALDSPPGAVAYTASKAGVVAMTLTVARDLALRGIRCCCIAPGNFNTPMFAGIPEAVQKDILSGVPFPNEQLGDPEYFAQLACHVCENVMFNGETIRLDGALRMS